MKLATEGMAKDKAGVQRCFGRKKRAASDKLGFEVAVEAQRKYSFFYFYFYFVKHKIINNLIKV